ncbi:MAG TPA: HIT domain-containing protein [Candidatus Paceibacterota bacterium]|nr:HIT domain-containing protein [Candidatus Paceibacterota bacterium]
MAKPCPFCPMFDGATEQIVIPPLNPVVPGHLLVIPREHVTDFAENPGVTARIMRHAAIVARTKGGEWNLITSKGEAATQSVFHLHVHLVPRNADDGLHLPWTRQKR